MKMVFQRVESSAYVYHEKKLVSQIGKGCILYIGFEKEKDGNILDDMKSLDSLVEFLDGFLSEDEELLCLSQFTLLGKFKGARPSFHCAEEHLRAKHGFEKMVLYISEKTNRSVSKGIFGVHLEIDIKGVCSAPFLLEYNGKEIFIYE